MFQNTLTMRKCLIKPLFETAELSLLFYIWTQIVLMCVFTGVLKMDTHLAGIICRAVSIFATNVLITTTEGNVDRTTPRITLKEQ